MKLSIKTQNGNLVRSFSKSDESIVMPSLTVKSGELTPADIMAISQTEVSYFSLGEKLTIKLLLKRINNEQPSQIEKTEPSPRPINSSVKNKIEEHQQSNAHAPLNKPTDKPVVNELDADKASLLNIGDSIEGMFHSFGSRNFGNSNASVIYLYCKKDLLFIRGTDFAEHKADNKIAAGDVIRVTKTAQYKQAKERDHAKPARFHIDTLEKNS